MSKVFKIDGAKFPDLQQLKDSLWPLYEAKMSKEEFEAYVKENVKEEG
ncbi:MAG: hypothetical protein MUF77_12790 [Leptospira sp.]|jgi:hypothetical protein|nr:hypothetical protein [Leptospira sp.]